MSLLASVHTLCVTCSCDSLVCSQPVKDHYTWNLMLQVELVSILSYDSNRVYSPRYSPTEWPSQMQVHYPLQLGTCLAQWWEIFFFPANSLWDEAANTAMLLKKNLVTPNRELSLFQHFWGAKEKHPCFSAKTCDMCITMYRDNSYWAKLAN